MIVKPPSSRILRAVGARGPTLRFGPPFRTPGRAPLNGARRAGARLAERHCLVAVGYQVLLDGQPPRLFGSGAWQPRVIVAPLRVIVNWLPDRETAVMRKPVALPADVT